MRLYFVSKQPLLAREGVLRCDPIHNAGMEFFRCPMTEKKFSKRYMFRRREARRLRGVTTPLCLSGREGGERIRPACASGSRTVAMDGAGLPKMSCGSLVRATRAHHRKGEVKLLKQGVALTGSLFLFNSGEFSLNTGLFSVCCG